MSPTIRFLFAPATIRLVVEGDVDLASQDELTARLTEATQMCADTLQLDVGSVSFIDCSGLRPIDDARLRLESAGKQLEITAASDWFRRVTVLAGYDELNATAPVSLLPRPA